MDRILYMFHRLLRQQPRRTVFQPSFCLPSFAGGYARFQGGSNYVVKQERSVDKHYEPDYLEPFERLPPETERYKPDE